MELQLLQGDKMRINTKFPVAAHIMMVIDIIGEEYCTSEKLALSVNTNPVVIRRINGMLKKANLITVMPGVGGARLNRAPKDISLLEIYNAVKATSDEALFDLHNEPNHYCIVGANIHNALSKPLTSAQTALEDTLAQYTLADLLAEIPPMTAAEIEIQRTMHLNMSE